MTISRDPRLEERLELVDNVDDIGGYSVQRPNDWSALLQRHLRGSEAYHVHMRLDIVADEPCSIYACARFHRVAEPDSRPSAPISERFHNVRYPPGSKRR